MGGSADLVGREAERAELIAALDRARAGHGSLVLVGGAAGVGKTRLAASVVADADAMVLRGRATQGAAQPYGLLVSAFRSHLRAAPDAFADLGRLKEHLAALLPEVGVAAPTSDRGTLFEAIRCGLAHIAKDRLAVLVLDDLHWSDMATLELLGGLAEPLTDLSVVVVGTYRSDGLPRDHGLRRLRNDLRRASLLEELMLEPLMLEQTGRMLTTMLGAALDPALVRAVHDRTMGVPFFIEELARALGAHGIVRTGPRGLVLAAGDEVPLPDTVRDAVLLGITDLSDGARAAADAAAVAGERFEIELVARVCGDAAVAELLEHGLVEEGGAGWACFNHALSRESIYSDIPWLRRRRLHHRIAELMEEQGAPASLLATQWIAAREPVKARAALMQAASEFEAAFAYRDAAEAGREVLELWDEAPDDGRRIQVLERYARCSELAGDASEAVRAWRELTELLERAGGGPALAAALRNLARAHDLRGEPQAAFSARDAAARTYNSLGLPAEAAVDHLAMANHLRIGARHAEAAELARVAVSEAEAAGHVGIRVRALGLEGLARAKGGDYEHGLTMVRSALALALEHELTPVSAELYQRLSVVLYDAADYRSAAAALDTALELCRADGAEGIEELCVSCLAYVQRDLGEWADAAAVCREMIDSGQAVFVAEGLLGSIHAYQGRLSSGRRLLNSCLAVATRVGHYNMTIDSTTALAFVAAAEGLHDEASERCRALLARWNGTQDHHYALSGLRWSAAYLARQGDRHSAHGIVDALSTIAAATGQPEALAAVAHAIAELTLLDGDAATAATQLTNALELHRTLDMPYVCAQIELRAGVALGAAGDGDAALERLSGAYRTARKLGARPLAAEAAREAVALGGSVVERLGRNAQQDADGTGLSRREREVVRLMAVGRTNREIAQQLFLSPRTVDMHVRNILRKLDCRSRVEAANRANELGLVS